MRVAPGVFTRIDDLGAALQDYPTLAALERRVRELPTMAAYLADPTKRFPFPGLPGYMERVRGSIPWTKPDGSGPPPPDPLSTVWNYKL